MANLQWVSYNDYKANITVSYYYIKDGDSVKIFDTALKPVDTVEVTEDQNYLVSSDYRVFVYDKEYDTCELYEIKHSQQYAPSQCRYLLDEAMLAQTESRFGKITKRCVLYRGAAFTASNGIVYENVEEYLKKL